MRILENDSANNEWRYLMIMYHLTLNYLQLVSIWLPNDVWRLIRVNQSTLIGLLFILLTQNWSLTRQNNNLGLQRAPREVLMDNKLRWIDSEL